MIEFFDLAILALIALGLFFLFFWRRKSSIDQSQNEAIRDLERRITDLMLSQLKEIRGTVDGSSRIMMDQVRSFTKETVALKEDLKGIQEKMTDISSFQELFRSPKLRGQWGEASLEHILAQHFPLELYQAQYLFSSGEQVDFVLKLPNGRILPIDAKFSSENFEKMVRASNEQEKKFCCQNFIRDVKGKINEVASKYIVPSEKTVDFALIYIPAEAIYYEIMFNLAEMDLAKYAWSKKIVLTSPNTIYLTLRTIEHWFRDTQISKRTQEILKRLERVSQDAKILFDDFRKLGRHLGDATTAYDRSEKRLSLLGRRVHGLIETGQKKRLKEGESNH